MIYDEALTKSTAITGGQLFLYGVIIGIVLGAIYVMIKLR